VLSCSETWTFDKLKFSLQARHFRASTPGPDYGYDDLPGLDDEIYTLLGTL
jgi:hypothetical protein